LHVELRPIDAANRDACLALSVSEAQAGLIAANARSLAWADANPACVPLGVYADGTIVGFALFEPRGNEVFSIHRFMIDERYQRRGIGVRAMQVLMDRIAGLGGKTLYLSFRPENTTAKRFYELLGFEYHATEPDGELIYRWGKLRELPA
jgi:diamine N-acetyltransferase